MIKALIQNGDDRTLLLTLPSARMKLAGSLTYLGINKPASEISCLADEENGISVKLFGDDAVDNKIIMAVKAETSLATLNTACDLIDTLPFSARINLSDEIYNYGISSIQDLFGKIKACIPKDCTETFYCPLTVNVFERNDYGDINEEPDEFDGRYAAEYEDQIKAAIDRDNARDNVNMAEYFDGSNGVQSKLKSMQWGVQNVRGELYGCIKVDLTEPLTDSEKAELIDFISAQNSDGWGEGFEQRPIDIGGDEMYVSFWHSGDDYFIYDHEEFDSYLENDHGMGGIE